MRRATAQILATIAFVGLAGCNVAKPASQTFGLVDISVADAPEAVISSIAAQAARDGYTATQEDPRSVYVNFGVSEARVPVPTRYGIWGSRVTFRDTKVAASAFYEAFPTASGTRVRMIANPIYWHPDIGTWLPGPYDVNPGGNLLTSVAGGAAEEPVAEDDATMEFEGAPGEAQDHPVGMVVESPAAGSVEYEVEEVFIEMEEVAPAAPAAPAMPSAPASERLPTPPHLQGK